MNEMHIRLISFIFFFLSFYLLICERGMVSSVFLLRERRTCIVLDSSKIFLRDSVSMIGERTNAESFILERNVNSLDLNLHERT